MAIHICLDDSGDLGFGTGGSRYFVVAALATYDPRALDRLIKKEDQRLGSKGARSIEHKFNKSNERVGIQPLPRVAETDSTICWRAIDKVNTETRLKISQDEIYRCSCAGVLNDIIPHRSRTKVVIHLDRMASKKSIRGSMTEYLMSWMVSERNGESIPSFMIEHRSSHNVPGLQVQDFVVGAVFQYLERGSTRYYNVVENKAIHGVKGS